MLDNFNFLGINVEYKKNVIYDYNKIIIDKSNLREFNI